MFEDVALELHFDPEADVADGRDGERVAMAGRAGSFCDILGLRDVGWEGGAQAGECDVDGTTADVNN